MASYKNKASFPISIENGKISMHPTNRRNRDEFVASLGTCNAIETIEKERKPKTPSQLGYLFGAIIRGTKRVLDERGEDVEQAPYTEDQIKEIYYCAHHKKLGGTLENFNTYERLSDHDDQEKTSEFITIKDL